MALRGEPGALIDECIHLATTDDLHMQFDIVIIISTGNKTISLHDGLKNLYQYIFDEN